jgi:dimeric dUTPase (all-alpha-NTP-PPase superfamily)
MQIIQNRQDVAANIREEIGIVIEEIGDYLKAISERTLDENLINCYKKYIGIANKLIYGYTYRNKNKESCHTQTDIPSLFLQFNPSSTTLDETKSNI